MGSESNLSGRDSPGVNEPISTITDEKKAILSGLSTLEPQKQHSHVTHSRIQGVGDWFLETAEFRSWRDDDNEFVAQTLFCDGAQGAGKTFISSLVIDNLCDINDSARVNLGVAYIYNDYHDQTHQGLASIMGSLLKQLVFALPDIPEDITEAFQKSEECRVEQDLLLPTILKLFPNVLASFSQVFIIIDALDEFSAGTRFELFRSLRQIIQDSPKTRLFLTGRSSVRSELEKHLASPAISISIQPTPDDIEVFSKWKLSEDPVPDWMDDSLMLEILAQIHKLPRIFLLATFYIDAILGETSIFERREMLHRIPAEFDDAYSMTLERVMKQRDDKAQLGIAALMWISFAERPLHVDELRHAISVEEGATDLNPDNIPSKETLLESCLGLITIDQGAPIIRVVHVTLKEYLSNHSELFENAHSRIAEICLTYLNFRRIKDLPLTIPTAPSTTPFLQYASSYWVTHAKMETAENVKSLALELLSVYPNHISAAIFLRNSECFPEEEIEEVAGTVTGLHYAAFFGLAEISIGLLDMGSISVNPRDGMGCTPLVWAIRRGYEEVVRLLLDSADVDADSMGIDRRTPLHWAAAKGDEGIVKLLLGRNEVNPDSLAIDGQTPLFYAVNEGHENIVKLLLERGGVNPDVKVAGGQTPLLRASAKGYEGIVEALLAHQDIHPNLADDDSRTPLSLAAGNGHEGAVKILLCRDAVSVNESDNCNRTPFSWAAGNGHVTVMELLLEREYVDFKVWDSDGRTPLSWAAGNGHEAATEMLLSQQSVDPNQEDQEGQTPLFWAIRNEREATAKVLLGYVEVNPNLTNNQNRTPLSWAAEHGYGTIVKLLLGREDIASNSQDNDKRTPLSWAAGNGHEKAVKLLMVQKGIDLNSLDNHDQTPLFWAVRNGRAGVTELLLGLRDPTVDVNIGDDQDRTPLFWAAGSGNEEISKLLLTRIDIKLDYPDDHDRTPLFWAVQNKHEGVVGLLLDRQLIDPNFQDCHGRTPLSLAAGKGHENLVEMILRHQKVNPSLEDKHRQTPLSWASMNGHEVIVKALLSRSDADINRIDDDCRTALSWAAEHGHEGVVKLLLDVEGVALNLPSSDERTPLLWASLRGHEGIVKLLLSQEEIDPNAPDHDQRVPLSWAVANGFEGITSLLLGRKDIKPNVTDDNKRSPLSYAAENGHNLVIVHLLKHNDITPNTADNNDQTPTFWAALKGHEETMALLLQHEGLDSNLKDRWGYSPLAWASKKGYEGIVKLLLGREDIEPNSEDKNSRTPFFWACINGHKEIVGLLLDHQKINPNLVDVDNRSPAEWAEENDHAAIVKLFQDRGVCIRPFPEDGAHRPVGLPTNLTSVVPNITGKQHPVRPHEGKPILPPGYPVYIEAVDNHKNKNPDLTTTGIHQVGHQESVETPFNQEPSIDFPESDKKLTKKVGSDNERATKELVDESALSKTHSVSRSNMLATRLIKSCLDFLPRARNQNLSRQFGRFRLWADEYGTAPDQLDKVLEESQPLMEAIITLLADLCNILILQTSHSDGTRRKKRPSVLEEACTMYPGISQLFPDSNSDSGGEEDEIETIVDSLFNLSPLLVDILENLPENTSTGVGNDEATSVSEAAQKLNTSAHARLLWGFLLILFSCLLLFHQMTNHT